MDDSNNEGATQRPVQPAAPGVRPMRRDDLPAVEVVLNSAFKRPGLIETSTSALTSKHCFSAVLCLIPNMAALSTMLERAALQALSLPSPCGLSRTENPLPQGCYVLSRRKENSAHSAPRACPAACARRNTICCFRTRPPRQRRSLACDRRQHVADGKPAMAQGAQAFQRDCPAHAAPFASSQIQARTYGAWICGPYPAIVEKGHKA